MPTLALKVQQNGRFQGWSTIIGATFAYQAVDDSDGTSHDSGTTFFTLPRLNLDTGAGRVSFPLFLQAEGLVPLSITLNVVATRGGALHPELQIGFQRGGLSVYHTTKFNPGATWDLAQRTFSTNPITGGPWSASDLAGLEVAVQNESGVNGNNDLTLVSGSITYAPMTNAYRSEPWAQPL